MTSYSTSGPKLTVRDSYDEDEISDDIDDEVFIRDGRNGFKVDDERGAKRPLMAPRRKSLKSTQMHSDVCKGPPCRIFCAPCCYGILALAVLLGVIVLVVFLVNSYPSSLNDIAPFWKMPKTNVEYLPCTAVETQDIWTKSFPKLTTESSFRLMDVNKDGILDVILGYGTGADGYDVPAWVCSVYFSSYEGSTATGVCLGGIMALDGKTGNTIWRRPLRHEVFGLDCSADITNDSLNDCIATGRGGVFCAVSGYDGSIVWEFGESRRAWLQGKELHSIFSAQFVEDMDSDGVQDILAVESGSDSDGSEDKAQDDGEQLWCRLWLVSGAGGVIGSALCPGDMGQSQSPPRLLLDSDGGSYILLSISGSTGNGSLYVINLWDLLRTGNGLNRGKRRKKKKNAIRARLLFQDPTKRFVAPPALADLNGDGTEDIVVATCNSSILAFDGRTLHPIWTQSLPSHSESFSSPAFGYYNEDDIPDVIIRFHTGPEVYKFYYSQVAILNGKTGEFLHGSPFVTGAGPPLGSPLTLSLHGPPGRDLFIYWSANCKGHSQIDHKYYNGIVVPEQASLDVCRLRYGSNSSQTGQLLALGRFMSPPGVMLYNSENRRALEHNNSVDILSEIRKFLEEHQQFWDTYNDGTSEVSMDGGEMSEDSLGEGKPGPPGEEEETKGIPYPNWMHKVGKHGWGRGIARPSNDPRLNSWEQKREVHATRPNDGLLRLLSTGTLAPSVSPEDLGTGSKKYMDLIFATHWIPVITESSDRQVSERGKSEGPAIPPGLVIPMGQMTVYRVRLHCQCSLSKGKDPNLFECPSFVPFKQQGWPSHMGARGNGYFRPRWS
ncbi:uncharacterized protein [Hetaerina americana]|uniref:uncharacterized protein n=1 Tax=Hetaerina americana TaxID=62018 RepID=UPI003A7F4EB5